MGSTKSVLSNIGEALGAKAAEFTLLNPPLIAAPFTTITDLSGNLRQLPDPSKTLKPAMGVERVHTKSLKLSPKEKGSNGEPVWKAENDDARIRFVGTFTQQSGNYGPYLQTLVVNDFVEVTFYGTGLNLIQISTGSARDFRASVDGGAEGANLFTVHSDVLGARNYNSNLITPVVSGLTLGTHTVKIRLASSVLSFSGFEILNESTQIKTPAGEIFAAGRKFVNPTLQSIAYDSGFDGNPILNGRGGRVVEYITPQGRIGKVIQQTNAAQLNLTAANHSNEELIREIGFREFGANRSDDFSTLGTVSARAFTLDDGTTTLVSSNAIASASSGSPSPLESVIPLNNGIDFITLTFVGTGLDVLTSFSSSSTTNNLVWSVNGTSIGNMPLAGLAGKSTILKVVSGLPYGTHTVRFTSDGSGSLFGGIAKYMIYGPKKPSIPSGAQEISEYYLMADFLGSASASLDTISRGVLRKAGVREFVYTGTWTTTLDVVNLVNGIQTDTTANGATASYTFFGTGFVYKFRTNTNRSNDIRLTLDESTDFSSFTTNLVGSGSWTPATGVLNIDVAANNGNELQISGLALGLHTITFLNDDVQQMSVEALDIITPTHYPNTKTGSLSMGPGVQLQKETSLSGVDLSKAKAWLQYDTVNSTILASFNVSGVIQRSTANILVFFEKAFKSDPICLAAVSNTASGIAIRGIDNTNLGQSEKKSGVTIELSAASNRIYLACFGELEDEE